MPKMIATVVAPKKNIILRASDCLNCALFPLSKLLAFFLLPFRKLSAKNLTKSGTIT